MLDDQRLNLAQCFLQLFESRLQPRVDTLKVGRVECSLGDFVESPIRMMSREMILSLRKIELRIFVVPMNPI